MDRGSCRGGNRARRGGDRGLRVDRPHASGGEGLGRDLWQLVVSDYKSLFWRARSDNAILPFYLQECDGMARAGEWHVFWKGLPPERIADAIAYALTQPSDLPDAR